MRLPFVVDRTRIETFAGRGTYSYCHPESGFKPSWFAVIAVDQVNVGISPPSAHNRPPLPLPTSRRTARTSSDLGSDAGDCGSRTHHRTTSWWSRSCDRHSAAAVAPADSGVLHLRIRGGLVSPEGRRRVALFLRVHPPDVLRHVLHRGVNPALRSAEGAVVRPVDPPARAPAAARKRA